MRNDHPALAVAADWGLGALMREVIAELKRTQAVVLEVTGENRTVVPLLESIAVLREFGWDIRGLAVAIAIGERLEGPRPNHRTRHLHPTRGDTP
jgi:hypothetical protein